MQYYIEAAETTSASAEQAGADWAEMKPRRQGIALTRPRHSGAANESPRTSICHDLD